MKFKTISVLLPTRGRLASLDRALRSLRELASDASRIEIICRCDDDDSQTQDYLRTRGETLIIGPRERGYASVAKFMNQCAARSTGDILVMFNDDAFVETPGWDAKIAECANRFPDGVFDIGVDTGYNDELFPFSIVSRPMYHAWGQINDERLLYLDIFLLDVARSFGRAIRLPEVRFTHDWPGKGVPDKTRLEGNELENTLVFDGTPGDSKNPKKNWRESYRRLHDLAVGEAVEKLRQKMEGTIEPIADLRGSILKDGFLPKPIEPAPLDALMRRLAQDGNLGAPALIVGSSRPLEALWRRLFREVVFIRERRGFDLARYESFENGRIYEGPLPESRFLFRFRDCCLGGDWPADGRLKVLVLGRECYGISMASYFVFKKTLGARSAVVFVHESNQQDVRFSNGRLVQDLSGGVVDGTAHRIEDFRDSRTGAGFSVEGV